MKAAVLKAAGIDNLAIVDLAVPEPGPGQVLVRMTAASLNYRDLLTVEGGYGSRQKTADLVILSDGAGEVAGVGAAVRRFRPGDRVVANFFQDWIDGRPSEAAFASALGGSIDGVLAEYRLFPEHGLVATPEHLSDVEAAALPCAGLTAWSALVGQGRVAPGELVLTLGTGGVSLFALMFAKLAGAEVVVTSSSAEKLERALDLGADHAINYREVADWGRRARAIAGGLGVDHVVELGGAGTLDQSLRAVRVGGTISLIGVLAGASHAIRLPLIVTQNIRLQGITVGSRAQFEAMLRAMALGRLRPPIDRVFPMTEIRDALAHLAAGRHFGKVCIEV